MKNKLLFVCFVCSALITSQGFACTAQTPELQVSNGMNGAPGQVKFTVVTGDGKASSDCMSSMTISTKTFCGSVIGCTQFAFEADGCGCATTALQALNSVFEKIQTGTLSTSDVNTTQNGTTVDASPNATTISNANTIGSNIASYMVSGSYLQLYTGN